MADGSVVAIGALMYRDDPEKSVVNVPTLGYTEMELIITRSQDRGHTWGPIERVEPPLEGPAFEVCHSIVELRDGRWVWPCSTWMGWDGDAPNGMNAILLVSEDQGRTWPSYITEFDRWAEGIIHWEQYFLELRDGRWLTVAWAVDLDTGKTLATPYAVSSDQGATWHRGLTGFLAQTTKPIELPDGRILAVYRRNDEAGLWATTARLEGDDWVNEETVALWRGQSSGMTGDDQPRRGAGPAEVRLPADGPRAGRRRLPRLLVRGGLHQEHPLAAPRGLILGARPCPRRPRGRLAVTLMLDLAGSGGTPLSVCQWTAYSAGGRGSRRGLRSALCRP